MFARDRLLTSTKRATARLLRAGGYQLQRIERTPRARFDARARTHFEQHEAQTLEIVAELRERYREPVFGVIPVWDVVEMLAHLIDPLDHFLMNVSQEVHTLQVLEGMKADGVVDESLLLTAILHDVGKVLLLVGEQPANVSGCTEPIGEYEPGRGLDNCVLQWGADEFAYSRFAGRVPDHVSWLIRYHSINPASCLHLMDDRDHDYYERYGEDFRRWDSETKSIYLPPRTRIGDYRGVVDQFFSEPIPF